MCVIGWCGFDIGFDRRIEADFIKAGPACTWLVIGLRSDPMNQGVRSLCCPTSRVILYQRVYLHRWRMTSMIFIGCPSTPAIGRGS